MELNVTPLQLRTATYAAAVNKTRSWKETRLWARQAAEPAQSPPVAGFPHSSSLHFHQITHGCHTATPPGSDLLFRWTWPPTL